MGMFNEFLNNNNNIDTLLVNTASFLTNNERMQLKQDLKNGKSINGKMNAIVKRKLNEVNMKALKISPLKLGFFNAIVNDKFDKKERIDLVSIFNKKPHKRKSIPRTSLEIEIKSIKLYHGQFKVAAEHSLSGIFGEQTKKNFMVQIAAHVYDGKANQGITFRVYRNGKIHFSGGILNNNIKQPEQIRKYIVDTFTNRETFLYSPIIFNNTAGQFDVNGALNLPGIARAFRMSSKIDYEPELRAALRMDYMGSSFQMFTTGIVQILGARSEKEMIQAYEYGKDLVTQLYVMKLLIISNKPSKKAKAKTNVNNRTLANIKNNIPLAQLYPEAINKKAPKNNTVRYNDKRNVIKIGKRSCARLPKPELVAVAKRIGVVDIKSTTTKEKICDKIKARVFGNFKVNKKPCLSYTKAQLIPIAVAKGISVTDNDTVKTLCEKLKVGPPKVAKKVVVKNDGKAIIMKKRRLTNNTIRKNLETLYGKRWLDTYRNVMPSLNENVAEIKKRVEALNVKKDKKGIPFKKNVNAIKKSSVRSWKFQRKKMLNNKLNALNNNLANELENLMNVEVVKKKSPKKKFPKGTKVEQL